MCARRGRIEYACMPGMKWRERAGQDSHRVALLIPSSFPPHSVLRAPFTRTPSGSLQLPASCKAQVGSVRVAPGTTASLLADLAKKITNFDSAPPHSLLAPHAALFATCSLPNSLVPHCPCHLAS
jgi:hypothetical protein